MESKQQQEYEFVMEGITTRMQIALEKMADSNRMMSETNKRLCSVLRWGAVIFLLAILGVAFGFLANNRMMINHINNIRGSGVSANETVSEYRPGADD